ncbi:hypothetical protein NLI96_g8891 [Meripilus lineatus]|uniref:C2H2-type domain-containing protein n=1 Tax=Meripilus lineatus TaxID=2056292 RepID=A0AAD5V160_9APHY|nr:hypothetical protein NLI96_g8891 [Physisporinus lineatus]
MNRHMCSLHSVNVEDQSFNCPYCHQLCFALFNLNQHIKRHFAQRDNVCCTVLRVQDDDSILVICGYCSTATNDLERHREFHERDNFYIQSVDSLKTPYHKLAYVKPEDRVAGPTKEDKPKVCPQFHIRSEFLNGPLPACFLPSPEYLEKVKNGLIDPKSTKKRRGRRKATIPSQPPPGQIFSERYNPPPRAAPLTSPHDLTTVPSLSPDYSSTSSIPDLPFQTFAPNDAPHVIHEEAVIDISLCTTQFHDTTPTTDKELVTIHSYNLNPAICIPPTVNDGTLRFLPPSDFTDLLPGTPFRTDAQSHEGIANLPLRGSNTISAAPCLYLQSPASVPTPEESAFYASLFTCSATYPRR